MPSSVKAAFSLFVAQEIEHNSIKNRFKNLTSDDEINLAALFQAWVDYKIHEIVSDDLVENIIIDYMRENDKVEKIQVELVKLFLYLREKTSENSGNISIKPKWICKLSDNGISLINDAVCRDGLYASAANLYEQIDIKEAANKWIIVFGHKFPFCYQQ